MLAEVWFLDNGTRTCTPHGMLYRPHVVIKGKHEYLGVQFEKLEKSQFGEHMICAFYPLYDGVDYSELKEGSFFELREGRNMVGEGVVIES